VIADREPGEGKPPLLFAHADEREVARSAADVDDEDDVAGMDELAPRVARRLHPGVERGLRLFEESEVPEPRLGRGLHRQFARGRVERGGHRERHRLVGELVVLVRCVPGRAQMGKDARARFDR